MGGEVDGGGRLDDAMNSIYGGDFNDPQLLRGIRQTVVYGDIDQSDVLGALAALHSPQYLTEEHYRVMGECFSPDLLAAHGVSFFRGALLVGLAQRSGVPVSSWRRLIPGWECQDAVAAKYVSEEHLQAIVASPNVPGPVKAYLYANGVDTYGEVGVVRVSVGGDPVATAAILNESDKRREDRLRKVRERVGSVLGSLDGFPKNIDPGQLLSGVDDVASAELAGVEGDVRARLLGVQKILNGWLGPESEKK